MLYITKHNIRLLLIANYVFVNLYFLCHIFVINIRVFIKYYPNLSLAIILYYCLLTLEM